MIERTKLSRWLIGGVGLSLWLGATGCDAMSKNPEASAKCVGKKNFASVECLDCCIDNGATTIDKGSIACACHGHGHGRHPK